MRYEEEPCVEACTRGVRVRAADCWGCGVLVGLEFGREFEREWVQRLGKLRGVERGFGGFDRSLVVSGIVRSHVIGSRIV